MRSFEGDNGDKLIKEKWVSGLAVQADFFSWNVFKIGRQINIVYIKTKKIQKRKKKERQNAELWKHVSFL